MNEAGRPQHCSIHPRGGCALMHVDTRCVLRTPQPASSSRCRTSAALGRCPGSGLTQSPIRSTTPCRHGGASRGLPGAQAHQPGRTKEQTHQHKPWGRCLQATAARHADRQQTSSSPCRHRLHVVQTMQVSNGSSKFRMAAADPAQMPLSPSCRRPHLPPTGRPPGGSPAALEASSSCRAAPQAAAWSAQ